MSKRWGHRAGRNHHHRHRPLHHPRRALPRCHFASRIARPWHCLRAAAADHYQHRRPHRRHYEPSQKRGADPQRRASEHRSLNAELFHRLFRNIEGFRISARANQSANLIESMIDSESLRRKFKFQHETPTIGFVMCSSTIFYGCQLRLKYASLKLCFHNAMHMWFVS